MWRQTQAGTSTSPSCYAERRDASGVSDRPRRRGAFIEYAENRIVSLERKILDVVYVGTMQDGDGKLFVEDVPEYHPARETTEIEDSRMESLEILDKASDHLSPSELATRIRRMAAEERMERLF